MSHCLKINKKVSFFWYFYLIFHTIRKVKFLSKNSILTKIPTFSRVFHPIFFWQFFSWNQSCQQLKSPKPQHFHEFFTPQKNRQFSREIKVEFLDKKWRFRTVCFRVQLTFIFFFWNFLPSEWIWFGFCRSHPSFWQDLKLLTDATAGWCGFSISQGLSKWNGNGCFKATKFTLCTQRQR